MVLGVGYAANRTPKPQESNTRQANGTMQDQTSATILPVHA